MAETATGTNIASATKVRPFRPLDHRACRDLWAELTEEERRLYDDPRIGGNDPGAGFEQYVARLELSGMWVADHAEDGVIGFVGLILQGRKGEVEPIVVTRRYRRGGVGNALLDRVAAEARRRRLRQLTITPSTRNEEAIRSFHRAGYQALEHVTLTYDLVEGGSRWQDGIDLHGARFRY
ncbi:MAG: GNAT family N-acetyltransferase [Actinocatenispora sp.]